MKQKLYKLFQMCCILTVFIVIVFYWHKHSVHKYWENYLNEAYGQSTGQFAYQTPPTTYPSANNCLVGDHSGSCAGYDIIGSTAQFHQLTLNTTGTVTTCSGQVDTSVDGITWTLATIISAQNCGGNTNIAVISAAFVVNYVRVNITTLTGGGSVVATLTGYSVFPATGGSTGVISVTPFFSGTDICGKFKTAISALPAGTGGNTATIDARQMVGTYVCQATNANTMLDRLRATQNLGGVLLLGNTAIYCDGPASGNNFTDSFGSVIGTPCIIIPSNFSIIGMGRGGPHANNPPTNTVIGACTGNNNPISAGTDGSRCQHNWPTRQFPIASETYFTGGGIGSSTALGTCTSANPGITPNLCVLLITVSSGGPFVVGGQGSDPAGANIYIKQSALGSAEVGAIINTQATPADLAGMYELQAVCTANGVVVGNIPAAKCLDGNTIGVAVPSGLSIGVCAAHCGTWVMGTPLIGFAPPGANSYTAAVNAGAGVSSFGQRLESVMLDLNQSNDVMGVKNYFGQEQGDIKQFACTNTSFLCYEEGTNNEQNFGPIDQFQMSVGTANGTCGPHTTAAFLHSLNINREFKNITITFDNGCSSGAPRALTGIFVDTVDRVIMNVHGESVFDVIKMGANQNTANITIINATGGPSGFTTNSVVHIMKEFFNADFFLSGFNREGGGNTITDDINLSSVTDPKTAFYSDDCLADNTTCSLLTTTPTVPNLLFPQLHVIGNLVQNTSIVDISATAIGAGTTIASFTITPKATARNYTMTCDGIWTQATAVATVTFTIQAATTAPTQLGAVLDIYTNTTAKLGQSVSAINNTTQTPIGAAITLGAAAGTFLPFHLMATMELPANAAGNTVLTFGGFTSAGADHLQIQRDMGCVLY